MPYYIAPRPNSGLQTGLDVDGDGQVGRARDAQGYGRFAGQRGMLLLSRHPFAQADLQDFSSLLWSEIPNNRSADPPELAAIQRLATVAHIQIPVLIQETPVTIISFHATPPVFDGPEDRNGRRNADEIDFWTSQLAEVPRPFVILANTNADPNDGEGLKDPIRNMLAHPALQDPKPASLGAKTQRDPTHQGNPAFDTVDWPDDGPGNLRVSYALPSSDLGLDSAGVNWSVTDDNSASHHRLVWVDVTLP